jgi:hypothetical protein
MRGELPAEVPKRDGIPILGLLGRHGDALEVEQALKAAVPQGFRTRWST